MPRQITGKIQLTPPFFNDMIEKQNYKKMSLKLVLLKSGETIISDVKEIIKQNDENQSNESICAYLLKNPYKITSQVPILLTEENSNSNNKDSVHVSLSPWMVLSSTEEIPISTDWVVTIVDPIDSLKNLYEENVNGQTN